jgi:hypothetical protein
MRSGVAGERPDADIMAPIERIARFMETLDSQLLNDGSHYFHYGNLVGD